MCYNCGCGLKDDDMGKGKMTEGGASLTETDLNTISEKWGMSLSDTKKHIHELLSEELKK